MNISKRAFTYHTEMRLIYVTMVLDPMEDVDDCVVLAGVLPEEALLLMH